VSARRVKTDTRPWIKARAKALRRDNHLCQVCKRAIATQVDHIIPAHQLNSVREELELDNLQSICYPCHKLKSIKEQRGGADTSDLVDHYYV